MVGGSNQNVIKIDAWSFAEFEISEFEISRVDCMKHVNQCKKFNLSVKQFVSQTV